MKAAVIKHIAYPNHYGHIINGELIHTSCKQILPQLYSPDTTMADILKITSSQPSILKEYKIQILNLQLSTDKI